MTSTNSVSNVEKSNKPPLKGRLTGIMGARGLSSLLALWSKSSMHSLTSLALVSSDGLRSDPIKYKK